MAALICVQKEGYLALRYFDAGVCTFLSSVTETGAWSFSLALGWATVVCGPLAEDCPLGAAAGDSWATAFLASLA